MERFGINRETIGLSHDRLFPFDAEPGEVFEDCFFVFRFTACVVNVFDAEKEAAAFGHRAGVGRERRKSVADVEVAVGAWRESCDENWRGHDGMLGGA